MYRINPLPRKVLVTTDEVIAMGPTVENVDPNNLLHAIIIAEERFVKKFMCKNMYYKMRDEKNIIVGANNKSLLESKVNNGNSGVDILLEEGEMVNAIEEVTTPGYKEWWFEYGWKLVAECVVYIATPTNWSRYTAQGEVQNNPKTITGSGEGSMSGDLKDVKWKMDKLLMDRIDPLIEAMHEWMCDNKASLPGFDCHDCSKYCSDHNTKDGISYKRKTGWVHNIYDKATNKCC